MTFKSGSLEDMQEERITDYTKDGHCSDCGSCCSNLLPMTEKEIERIQRYIKKHDIKAQVHCAILAVDTMDMCCPFMDMNREKKCTIYPARPYICKSFMCNKRPWDAAMDPELWKEERQIVDVRATFYGGKE